MKKRITLINEGFAILVVVQIFRQVYVGEWRCISERIYRERQQDVYIHLQDFDEPTQRRIITDLLFSKQVALEFEID